MTKVVEEEKNKPYYLTAQANEEKAYALSAIAEAAITKANLAINKVSLYKTQDTNYSNIIYTYAKKEVESAKADAYAAIANSKIASAIANETLLAIDETIKLIIQAKIVSESNNIKTNNITTNK